MKTVTSFRELDLALKNLDRPLGFVPTMGFLHEGHLSLVREAKKQNQAVAVSIFTNPTQFSADEDLANYPKDLERDLELLGKEKADLVWLPAAADMYPEDFQTWVEVDRLTKVLEGRFRPTHFRGVTTIVAKLFNALQPERAYFGQKDAQQAAVIQQMVRDLNYRLEIVVCPIIREPDGLAMSSRNSYLSPQERKAALCLSRGLAGARLAYQEGERSADRLREIVSTEIEGEKLAKLQYVSCADPLSLEELEGRAEDCLLSLAVYVGQTRLIDNLKLSSGLEVT
jgi:pantoate--beta-alanine ligase